MDMQFIALKCALLPTACDNESDDFRADKSNVSSRVDSCDLGNVFGTCVEYSLSELDDSFLKHVESAYPKNKRGHFVSNYEVGSPYPSEDRVARCEGIIDALSE